MFHALALRTPFCDFDCGKGCGFDIVNRAEALNVPSKNSIILVKNTLRC